MSGELEALAVLRRGLAMAQRQHRPRHVIDLIRQAMSAIESGDAELLVISLLELGSAWQCRETLCEWISYENLAKRVAAPRKKGGQSRLRKHKVAPEKIRSRHRELILMGAQVEVVILRKVGEPEVLGDCEVIAACPKFFKLRYKRVFSQRGGWPARAGKRSPLRTRRKR